MHTETTSTGLNPTHAGGVVYRMRGTLPEVLVVTAKLDPSVWVLPKGHIEPGESPDQTAVREVFEEAGVTARIVDFLTTARQVVRGTPQQIEYFLMEMVAEETAREGRRVAWLTEDAAIRRITYEESEAVLMQGYARLAANRETAK
jgi:ADP-ribose pyrophosphatase YjhB (NUDIX family)